MPLDEGILIAENHPVDALILNDALEKLESADARLYEVALLHILGGLDAPEITEMSDVGLRTVERHLKAAMMFVLSEIRS